MPIDHPPLSCWSTGSAWAGGVAILLTPESAQKATAWSQELWNTRSIPVSINGLVLLNVYSHSLRPAREQFFADLSRWNLLSARSLVVGDFNCVQSPLLDLLGIPHSSRPESSALEALLDQHAWADARVLRTHADDKDADSLVDYSTYWAEESASRIDRFYVHQRWASKVCWVAVRPPPCASVHQEVELRLRVQRRPLLHTRRRTVSYPIQAGQPDRVVSELLDEVVNLDVGRTASVLHCDATTITFIECIRRVRKRAQQRRYRYKIKLLQHNRRQFLTRPQ